MLKLLGRKTSSNVMEVMWFCAEAGLEYDREDVGGPFGRNDEPEYLALNPNGLVPTVIDDGFVMWESNAILRYLATKYASGTDIWPDDLQVRAEADKWMDWQLSVVAAMITPIFWGMVRTEPEKRDMQAIGAAIQRGYDVWGMLDKHLEGRNFVAGDNLTLGDIPLGIHAFRWFSLVEKRPSMPNFEAWYARLGERPAYKEHCMNPLV
ncbi:MAG: glutathione S-transferase family protein [Pseudomonadota bacterium]